MKEHITAIVIGAGDRGKTYASFAKKEPDIFKVIAVAEPSEVRRKAFQKEYSIEDDMCFTDWESAFEKGKIADAAIICTQDKEHYLPFIKAHELGYHVLIEKPVSTNEKECIEMTNVAKKAQTISAVCHVLRYTPIYRKMKELIQSGSIGEPSSIEHIEPIGPSHFAHSYVRGKWRKEAESSPIILAKSCHDLDIMLFLADASVKKLASFGSLRHFRIENAPEGSSERCIEGCQVEAQCPYSTLKQYDKNHPHTYPTSTIVQEQSAQGVEKAMREGPYGRCVYRCDNDVCDRQSVSIEFENGITASFTMTAFAEFGGRRTRVMGTHGEIIASFGAEDKIILRDFRQGWRGEGISADDLRINPDDGLGDTASGHGGGDMRLTRAFVEAVRSNDVGLLSSTLPSSLESHMMAFAAEKSRREGVVVDMKSYYQ